MQTGPSILTGGKSASSLEKIDGRDMCDADSVLIDSRNKDDELRGDVEDPPIDLVETLLMREVPEYSRNAKGERRCKMCPFRIFNEP